MTVAVVIVTYRCRELVLECLESLERQMPGITRSVIVVDNASRDGTVESIEARWPAARILEQAENLGFARAANIGIEAAADADTVCLLNPDAVVVDAGILAAADYLAANGDVGVLGGRILNRDGSVQASARAFPGHRTAFFNRHSLTTKFFPKNRRSREYLMTDWAHDAVRTVDWVSGAFMFIHRRAIKAVGVFDPGYFWSIEDVDYCRRVSDAGLEVRYFPAATIVHTIGGSSRKAVYRAMAAHHRGMWRYYNKHLRGNRLLDAATFAGIWARFGLHAVSYALRSGRSRVLGRHET